MQLEQQSEEAVQFVQAICANPDDDTIRSVYADWLKRHGHHDRAGFIRDQLWLAVSVASGIKSSTANARRRKRLRQCFNQLQRFPTWFSPLCLEPCLAGRPDGRIFDALRVVRVGWPDEHNSTVVLRRGFVEALRVSWTDWWDLAPRVYWNRRGVAGSQFVLRCSR